MEATNIIARVARRLPALALLAIASAAPAAAQTYGDSYADPYAAPGYVGGGPAAPYGSQPSYGGQQPYGAPQPYGGVDARGYAPSLADPQIGSQGGAQSRYTASEVLEAGHGFFGATSGSLGALVERMFASHGLPNGYILGEEASGAWFGGLTFGEGVLHTRNAGSHRIYWQGPSIGLDWGAQGSRTMILVYNLPYVDAALGRFGGAATEAYAIGGLGARVLQKNGVVMVPIRTGVGARLGVNLNYLKFTPEPTWNPL